MIELKTSQQIRLMREAGRVVASALGAVRDLAAIGITLAELDRAASGVLAASGAVPAFLGYLPTWAPRPFPGVICVSVNDAIVHGVPDATELHDGDLVSIDCGAFVDGWCADAAISFVVGIGADDDRTLIEHTERALERGIQAAVAGARLGDIGNAVGSAARRAGYGLLADHAGHGVGRAMHESPFVPNEGRAGRGYRLKPGLVIAIEPMLILGGGDDYVIDDDGWTIRSPSGARAAHFEHTIAVTDDGPLVLTLP